MRGLYISGTPVRLLMPDTTLVRRASTLARLKGPGSCGGWCVLSEYRYILWADLRMMAVEDATYIQKVAKLLIEDPLDENGNIHFVEVWPTFGLN